MILFQGLFTIESYWNHQPSLKISCKEKKMTEINKHKGKLAGNLNNFYWLDQVFEICEIM